MANLIPVSYKLLKGMNESLILDIIRKMGPISRADIAKETNLTPPTVTNIVNKLIEEGVVVEYKVGESNGGRPPVLIKINPEFMTIIIVHISTNNLHEYTLDAELNRKSEQTHSIKGLKEQEVLELLMSTLDKAIKESPNNISGIGIVVRGPVKTKEGISVFAPNIGWRNVPLKAMIEEKFEIPTYIMNDVRAMAWGEFQMGKAKEVENMIFLKVGYGIGSAILINGRLYIGNNDSAGEIGHTTIDVAGPKCSCGNYGCFEALASEKALVNLVVKSIKEGNDSIVYQMAKGILDNVTPEMIYEAAKLNDKLAINSLETIGRYLGIGIANIINTFNPELILIGGGIVQGRSFFEDIMRETTKKRAFENSYSSCSIAFAELGDNATLIGAANMVMDEVL
ncbi:ROK family transcriptional regulator [Thermoanaerobacter mathranii]|uniref:transcriptional regulator GalR n=1 Tax=Thermoanaerobacter mathranii TaxID=583357 RepID=UPI003AAF9B09